MNNISLIVAFSAGLVSFFSPCVLPLVPAYISYITGAGISELKADKSKLYVLYKSLGFVIGFSFIFIAMGASATTLGKLLLRNKVLLRRISGLLIIIFGLHTTGALKIKYFYYEKKLLNIKATKGTFGSIFLGISFAAGWTPCVGQILSPILIYAGNLQTVNKGVILLTAYSLGLAVPFILTAMAIERLETKLRNLNKYLELISVISGILMIAMGILIYTNKLSILSRYLNFINF